MAFTPLENDIISALSRYRLSVSEIEGKMYSLKKIHRRTIQRALQKLCDENIITAIGDGRGRRYEKIDEGK